MVVIRQPQKLEARLFQAMVISLGFHCLVAALLFHCLQERRLLTLPQTIISVDISALEPEMEDNPRALPPAPAKADSRLPARAPLPATTIQLPMQRKVSVQPPLLSPVPAQATPVESLPDAQPIQVRSESTARLHSTQLPVGNPSRTDSAALTGNSVPVPLKGPIEVKHEQAYLVALKEIIERHKEYPLMARRGRMEGTVRISCKLTRTGEVKEAKVESSSGYEILDRAALRSVRSVGQFPVVPTEIREDPFGFVAPITFQLSR